MSNPGAPGEWRMNDRPVGRLRSVACQKFPP
jgi:hypothetical protein